MSPNKLRKTAGAVWVNVASSIYPLENFVNLDNHIILLALDYPILLPFIRRKNRDMLGAYRQAREKAQIVRYDCRKPLPFPNDFVDHILCSHFLEHVHSDEATKILGDYRRALKPGATMHIIVPDLERQINAYTERRRNGAKYAADDFIRESLLSRPSRGSLPFRVLEFAGAFGLQHRWMYDRESITARIADAGFVILQENDTPSRAYREGDDSVHVVARK